MSIYEDILRAQVKQGNFGGKHGPFAYLAEKKKRKPTKEIIYDNWLGYEVTVERAELYIATDSNGFSDPYVRIGKKVKDGLFSKKWVLQTPAVSKTLNPVWNYTNSFTVNIGKSSDLQLQLWDKDALKDDFIGSATFSVPTGLYSSQTKTVDIYDPKNSKIINAKVTFTIKCVEKASKEALSLSSV
ncbi:hypothetical protein SAMD00019534_088550 [Acytostelium subglobosum LB1]|uniref:hypothetical protein n=1 Tax=Acytostelium subglobosum LB1 TaxID=1410327 RepID=UPI0006450CFC|nr:hypothetical protein SAMD00019534_088550 [Acytostelium subglobosum LB1]GAM25680.1 hypothetical protein SAMD00019534_088550 [Acytostelium subglobosum LB1]|eukprot:XP_012751198.1 hypothetical protein SAMD00019534_088550 [Acytostelium subglobosum LB1]